jgi:hypothetical protein
MYRQIVSGIGGHHEFPPPHTQQIVSRIIRSTRLWLMSKPFFRSSAVILRYP